MDNKTKRNVLKTLNFLMSRYLEIDKAVKEMHAAEECNLHKLFILEGVLEGLKISINIVKTQFHDEEHLNLLSADDNLLLPSAAEILPQ